MTPSIHAVCVVLDSDVACWVPQAGQALLIAVAALVQVGAWVAVLVGR